MPSHGYQKRMEKILSAQIAEKEEAMRPPRWRGALSLTLVVPLAMAAVFFGLKAALLAVQGEAAFVVQVRPADPGDWIALLRYWLGGIDPVTEGLARALAPLVEAARRG
ncbi:hypothetical protein [Pararhodobacter sp. SW119]|uniref:hypothetical protein n=1 Tax=Pararhodobacter sp. SW119 TaxID=2780075 RepID=UPI001AE0A586|nr:hypothetical protein [Pararhodobacter sp. SW119]